MGKDHPEEALGLYSSKDGFYSCSSVTLGNSLDLILLSDGEGVTGGDSLGGVDEFVGEGLSHRLVGSEGRLSGSLAEQVDSLVDSSEGRDINSLSSDSTTGTDSSGILSGTGLNDGLEDDLKGVLVSEQVDDLKGLSEDANGHLLLTVLATTTDHKLVDKSLENWALDLLESLLLVFTSGIRNKNLSFVSLDGQISIKGLLRALETLVRPLTKELGLNGEFIFYRVRWVVLKCLLWARHIMDNSLTGFYVQFYFSISHVFTQDFSIK